MININNAMLSPEREFSSPEEIVVNNQLTKAQKVDLLHRWAYDELELCVAEEENMSPQQSLEDHRVLDEIIEALHKLGEELKLDEDIPTKSGA